MIRPTRRTPAAYGLIRTYSETIAQWAELASSALMSPINSIFLEDEHEHGGTGKSATAARAVRRCARNGEDCIGECAPGVDVAGVGCAGLPRGERRPDRHPPGYGLRN